MSKIETGIIILCKPEIIIMKGSAAVASRKTQPGSVETTVVLLVSLNQCDGNHWNWAKQNRQSLSFSTLPGSKWLLVIQSWLQME
jgi:hypothetical protein